MKRLLVVFVVCLVFVACSEEIQPLKALQKGTPNTITLSTGDSVYDIKGEWDAILDSGHWGTFKDVVKISQQGNKYVGILSIGNQYLDKGSELIKGELEKNGFKSIQRMTALGWIPSIGKIDDGCNKIIVKTEVGSSMGGTTTIIATCTRK